MISPWVSGGGGPVCGPRDTLDAGLGGGEEPARSGHRDTSVSLLGGVITPVLGVAAGFGLHGPGGLDPGGPLGAVGPRGGAVCPGGTGGTSVSDDLLDVNF